jgi:membrane protein YdbS with pleckstrin-like domain
MSLWEMTKIKKIFLVFIFANGALDLCYSLGLRSNICSWKRILIAHFGAVQRIVEFAIVAF